MAKKKAEVHQLFGGKSEGPPTGGGGGGPGPSDAGWRDDLVLNREGKAVASHHNVTTILERHEDIQGVFKLDEFANRVMMASDPPWGGKAGEFTETDATELAAWLGQPATFSMGIKTALVMECVEAVARRHKYHPVREYLEKLKWDGEERIPDLFSDHFGAVKNDYTKNVALIFMISAVARIMQPGCKVDTMLVLEGKQGTRKTTSVRTLFGPAWYSEAMESPNSKDFYQSLKYWVVEIGELASFSKAEVHKVKQMLSAQSDTYRPSYGRLAREFPRQGVFVGTTNDDEWNKDSTGARRFLPIRCNGEINIDAIRDNRDQFWAEAVHRYKAGEAWGRLPADAEIEQEARYQEDSWLELVEKWLNGVDMGGEPGKDQYPQGEHLVGMLQADPHEPARLRVMYCSAADILSNALGIEVGKHGTPEQMRVAKMMKRLGWHKEKRKRGSFRRWEYIRPDDPAPLPAAGAIAPEVQT